MRLIARVCLAVWLGVAGIQLVFADEGGQVAFDWFEYQGKDEVFKQALVEDHYRNPIIAGFHPDPSIVRVGEDYYLVTSSFGYSPGLPVFHSRDLVNWKLTGHALTRRSQLLLENRERMSRGIFAGLVAFQSSSFHYFLGVEKSGPAYRFFLEELRDGASTILATAELVADNKFLTLGMEQENEQLEFYYVPSSGKSISLIRNVDVKLLSTQVAGGFVGTTIGIHARKRKEQRP